MQITFGAKVGQVVEKVLIDDPAYVLWMLKQPAPGRALASVVHHVSGCLKNLNARKFIRVCSGKQCGKTATQLSLYPGNPSPYYWCDSCDPYQSGASNALAIVKTYEAAVAHVLSHVGTKNACSEVVDSLLTAKGSKKPRRTAALVAFFSTSK